MRLEVAPFTVEHLESAAALLAARHRDDRIRNPDLPARYVEPAETLTILTTNWDRPGTQGMIALRGGIPVGYLLGKPELGAPTDAFAGDYRPRSAVVSEADHAADPALAGEVYPRLYAALAEQWLTGGLLAHYLVAPAGGAAIDACFALGFGQVEALAVRDTSPTLLPSDGAIETRLATTHDVEEVGELVATMLRAFGAPPTCWPFLPESLPALEAFVAPLVGDPASPIWLAIRGGRVLGLQLYLTPASPTWFCPALATPAGSIFLFAASTVPEARGTGVGSALLTRGLAWAQAAGYEWCVLYYLTASPAAAYWRSQSFRPLGLRLCRAVDERIAWVDGRG
jgi:GNAT superfamily N-acetyltransferase